MGRHQTDADKQQLSVPEYERQIAVAAEEDVVLRLYVAGTGPLSSQAIENLNHICHEHLEGHYELQVIDIHQQPEAVAEAQLVAAPTLVKIHPPPKRTFIGNLGHHDRILRGLRGVTARPKI